jgi:Uma2 family endonuclease
VATNEHATQELFLEAPALIAEVMSPSSRVYDAIDKFIAYRTIPQLQYYLLVKPEAPIANLLQRTPAGTWQGQDYTDKDALVELPSLGVSFNLGELY